MINLPKQEEPDIEKSQELKKNLLKKIETGDNTPIKNITSISGSREIKKILIDFVPYEFSPDYQYTGDMVPVPAFEGAASKNSKKIDLKTGELFPALMENNPEKYQAVLFINNVINFQLS